MVLDFDPPIIGKALEKVFYFTITVTCYPHCFRNGQPARFVALALFEITPRKLTEELISALFLIGVCKVPVHVDAPFGAFLSRRKWLTELCEYFARSNFANTSRSLSADNALNAYHHQERRVLSFFVTGSAVEIRIFHNENSL